MQEQTQEKKNLSEQSNAKEECEPSTSMIEDAEIGMSASCVTGCSATDSTKEIDSGDIKEEPMVQMAIELFEAKKITIQSKI